MSPTRMSLQMTANNLTNLHDPSLRNNYTNKIVLFKQANRKTTKKIVYKVRGGGLFPLNHEIRHGSLSNNHSLIMSSSHFDAP